MTYLGLRDLPNRAVHIAPSLPRALSWRVALVHVANRATAFTADGPSLRVDQTFTCRARRAPRYFGRGGLPSLG
jgi:hypothetical protein